MKFVAICYSGQTKLTHPLLLDISPSGCLAPSVTQRKSHLPEVPAEGGLGVRSAPLNKPHPARQLAWGSRIGHCLRLTLSLPPPWGQCSLSPRQPQFTHHSHPEKSSMYFSTSLAPCLHVLHQLESHWGVIVFLCPSISL